MQTRTEFIKNLIGAAAAACAPAAFAAPSPRDDAKFKDIDPRGRYYIGHFDRSGRLDADRSGSVSGKTCIEDMLVEIEIFRENFHIGNDDNRAIGLTASTLKRHYTDATGNGNDVNVTKEWLAEFYRRHRGELDA